MACELWWQIMAADRIIWDLYSEEAHGDHTADQVSIIRIATTASPEH